MPRVVVALPLTRGDPRTEDTNKIPDVSIVEQSAEVLYGLVHQRYILTRAGLQAMASPRHVTARVPTVG